MKTIKLWNLLRQSQQIYRKSMKELEEKYESLSFSEKIHFQVPSSFSFDFKKNFFTLLMISILVKSKISEERIVSYGKIIFCLRNLITSTDNMIDEEEKNITTLSGISNRVANNVFNLLLHQSILFQEFEKMGLSSNVYDTLLEEILFIAESEGKRERKLYQEYPSVLEIEEKIHRGIGGKLLQIALSLPVEIEKKEELKHYSEGLFEIGMALQALDDLVDMEEDEEKGKMNLARAFYQEHSEESQEEAKKKYLNTLLARAFYGFELFEREGYPIDTKTGAYLLKKLFILRGLEGEYRDILENI